MSETIRVRPARISEVATLGRLVETRLPDMMSGARWNNDVEANLANLVPDRALLVATGGSRLAGMIALDIDHQRIIACYLDPEVAAPDTPRRLFQGIEKIAVTFGIRVLRGLARKRVAGFMRSLDYEVDESAPNDDGSVEIRKNLLARADPAIVRILEHCDSLGVPSNYGILHRMPVVPEAESLVEVGTDIFAREQRMTPEAGDAWARMRAAASNAGVDLQLISAFRSMNYQTSIIRKKIEEGHSMRKILRVSAPPGYSEHHGGRAVDITTHGCRPLEESFAETRAYRWLQANARFFGFRESYPRNNRHQIAWEPWHWFYFKNL